MSTTNKEEKVADVSTENIYRLNGRVPLKKAIPFGLQHVLAMFVSNLAPVLIVCSAALVRGTGEHLTSAETPSFYNVLCSWQVSEHVCSYIRCGRSGLGFRLLWESALRFLEVC